VLCQPRSLYLITHPVYHGPYLSHDVIEVLPFNLIERDFVDLLESFQVSALIQSSWNLAEILMGKKPSRMKTQSWNTVKCLLHVFRSYWTNLYCFGLGWSSSTCLTLSIFWRIKICLHQTSTVHHYGVSSQHHLLVVLRSLIITFLKCYYVSRGGKCTDHMQG
jgi:hypothetical protein